VPGNPNVPMAWPFLQPVDLDKYKDYVSIVAEPMDLSKIKRKVEKGSYLDPRHLERDVRLMIANARKYNSEAGGKAVSSPPARARIG